MIQRICFDFGSIFGRSGVPPDPILGRFWLFLGLFFALLLCCLAAFLLCCFAACLVGTDPLLAMLAWRPQRKKIKVWLVGLLGCLVIVLLCGWVVGLLDCWLAGLLGC